MCKAMEERIAKVRIEALFNAIKGLMETMKLSAEQAMNAMQLSDSDKTILVKRF